MPAVTKSSLKNLLKSYPRFTRNGVYLEGLFLSDDGISRKTNPANMSEGIYWTFNIKDEFAFTIQHQCYTYTIHMPLKLRKAYVF